MNFTELQKKIKKGLKVTFSNWSDYMLGIPGFSESIDPDQLTPESIKKNVIGQIIERVIQHI